MLVEDGELKEVQVKFDTLNNWSDEYKRAVGEYIIAYSQSEYVYELLYKDLGLAKGSNFTEVMQNADNFKLTEIENKLKARNDCQEIQDIINKLKGYKANRDLLVHGFHHNYKGNRITHLSKTTKRTTTNIGKIPDLSQLAQESVAINRLVNELNMYRRRIFHNESNSAQIITTASAASVA